MNHEDGVVPIFAEVQRFRQGWVWVLIIVIAGVMWAQAIMQFLMDNPLGDDFMPDVMLIIFWILFGIGLPAMFLFGGLHTRVKHDALYVRFAPFHFSPRKIAYSDITKCEARTYRALREYGGWGIKGGKGGMSYTVSGDKGVQLEFTDRKPLLIGSQRAEELSMAIKGQMSWTRDK